MDARLNTLSSLVSMSLYLSACGSSGGAHHDVTATGGGGGSGGAPAAEAGSGGAEELDPEEIGAAVFDQDAVLEYRITMDPALYEDMKTNGVDEVYRKASLQVRGPGIEEDHEAVGLRYKGDYSLHHCWDDNDGVRSYSDQCAKLSMKIKFDEYDPEGRLFGLKRLNFNAMSYDESKLRERLAYSLFNEFGVSTSRTAHAKLYINDEAPLLVLAVEEIDGIFAKRNYPGAGGGDLYKEVWPRPAMSESVLLESLRTNENPEDNPDVAAFIAFGDAVGAATAATFVDAVAAFVDIEQLLRYMAIDRAIKNWDGITAFYWPERPHNYYWYHDEGDQGLFHLIPWDLDQTLWDYDPYMDAEPLYADRRIPNWNVRPLSCDPISVWDSDGEVTVIPPGCDNLINLLAATKWDDFAKLGGELLDTSFRYEVMNDKITAWAEQIAGAVDEDVLLDRESWEGEVEGLRSALQTDIEDFQAHLQEGYVVEE
jgi:spore coat protein H